jgi:dephospho-CoA kinase
LLSRVPIIGVVGPVGAGKSAVARLFASWEKNSVLISGDAIGHMVVDRSTALQRRLARVFGDDVLTRRGIDRGLLARRAFSGRIRHQQLNALVHPPLLKELRRQIREACRQPQVSAVIIDAALLVEWGRSRVGWDYLIGVWAPESERISRLARAGWTPTDVRRRARCQIAWKEKRKHCHCIVRNDGSLALLRRRVRQCWQNALSPS